VKPDGWLISANAAQGKFSPHKIREFMKIGRIFSQNIHYQWLARKIFICKGLQDNFLHDSGRYCWNFFFTLSLFSMTWEGNNIFDRPWSV